MSSPFPGMNPYLEHSQLWSEVRSRLIVAIADAVAPHLRPKYRVAIPPFPLPLLQGDTEPLVDLQALIHGVYDRAGFDLAIDYTREPVPPLSEADAIWSDTLLKEQGLR